MTASLLHLSVTKARSNMEYEPVEITELPDDTPELRIRRRKRAIYGCFTVFVIAKILILCWVLTLSFPLDFIGSLFRGELWSNEHN